MLGNKFNRLTVSSFSHVNKRRNYVFNCTCDCGNSTQVTGAAIRSGSTKSCGCYQKDRAAEYQRTHGLSKTNEYDIYMKILHRCYNNNDKRWNRYGGRGIVVCDEWLGSKGFTNFISSMGNRPSKIHSVGRINNDGPYSPENCRWETQDEQSSNKENSVIYSHNGESRCLSQWAKALGMTSGALKKRVNKWGIHEAFSRPVQPKTGPRKNII